MEPFATVDDLEAGWHALTEGEAARAQVLLERASAQLASMLAAHGIAVDEGDEVQSTNLKAVCCNMVQRAMATYATEGVQTMQQTIGSTSASVTWSNPDGAFYLSRMDRQVLGLVGDGAYRTVPAVCAGEVS